MSGLKGLAGYLPPQKTLMQRFRVEYDQTLFPPDFTVLSKGVCPLCFGKLKRTGTGVSLCRSKKHGKAFATKAV